MKLLSKQKTFTTFEVHILRDVVTLCGRSTGEHFDGLAYQVTCPRCKELYNRVFPGTFKIQSSFTIWYGNPVRFIQIFAKDKREARRMANRRQGVNGNIKHIEKT
jgi:hypothetical protein